MPADQREIYDAILALESMGAEVVPSIEDDGAIEVIRVLAQTDIAPGDRVVVWRQTRTKREDLPKIAAAMKAEAESMRVSLN